MVDWGIRHRIKNYNFVCFDIANVIKDLPFTYINTLNFKQVTKYSPNNSKQGLKFHSISPGIIPILFSPAFVSLNNTSKY